ncbi:MAG: glycosyltransferase family 2 protein [Saprospiraceae bacterium]
MKVAGFTFVRNAIKFDYPVVESIRSVLPLCDEFVIAVGNSEDGTLKLIQNIADPKIRIIETVWNDDLRTGGKVLAEETDKAFAAISKKVDWAFYIQADEVVHEKYYATIKNAMQKYLKDENVEALLFNYLHFYGSYDYVADSYDWYRREVRIVRRSIPIYSYRDAQGFRKLPNNKLTVKLIDAYIHHYGWVKDPRAMQQKQESFHKLWHDDDWVAQNVKQAEAFDYSAITMLHPFKGTHPKVIQQRIGAKNWPFDYDSKKNKYPLKIRLKKWIEKWTGWRVGEYRNYKIN